MKHVLMAAAAAAVLSTAALADTVVIQPEVQTQVREYVTTAPPAPATTSFEVSVGATVPAEVELHTFQGIPDVEQYRYVVVDNRTVLVDPSTRHIVTVIE